MSDYNKTGDILKARALEKEREEKRRELEQKKKLLQDVGKNVQLVSICKYCYLDTL